MKLFKKMLCFFIFSISFYVLFSISALAYDMYVEEGQKEINGVPSFMVSCCCHEKNGVVEIDGAFGSYTICCRRKFGHYLIKKRCLCSSGDVCEIVEDSAGSYNITFKKIPALGWHYWRIERPEGCAYWVITPRGVVDPYKRKTYINKLPNSDAWEIERKAVLPPGDVITEKVAIINFAPDIYGEIVDLVNFVIVIAEVF